MATFDLHQLLAIEHGGWHALCEGRAGDFYGAAMADDGLMLRPNGAILSRAEVEETLNDVKPWGKYTIGESRLLELGEGLVALIYKVNALRPGEPTYRATVTCVYRMERGRPKMVLYQPTTVIE